MTDKVTLNYLPLCPRCPLLLVFQRGSRRRGFKDALLYHEDWYTVFYALHDPLDNAVRAFTSRFRLAS